jgi:hypothetical protein
MVKEAVADLLLRAERHAARYLSGDAQRKEADAARHREAAWLLSHLTGLIQAALA